MHYLSPFAISTSHMCSKSSKFRNPTNSALQLPFKYNVHKGEQTRNKNCKEIRCPNSPYYLCEKQVSRCDTATPRHVGITDATDVPEIDLAIRKACGGSRCSCCSCWPCSCCCCCFSCCCAWTLSPNLTTELTIRPCASISRWSTCNHKDKFHIHYYVYSGEILLNI